MGYRPTRQVTKLVTLQTAAEQYGIGIPVLRDLIANGDLPAIRPPRIRRLYLDRQTLEAKIQSWTEVAR